MDNNEKKIIDNLLSSSFKGLKQADFWNLLNVFDVVQTKWNIFCTKEIYDSFKRWIERQVKKLSLKEISYKEFRENLVCYLAKIITNKYSKQMLILARDASFYKDEKELYQKAINIFGLIEN